MYCRNCGSEILEGSRFCNHCGSPVEPAAAPVAPETSVDAGTAPQSEIEEPVARKPIFEEFKWDVSEYPDRNNVAKTEDVDFNWNADPASISDTLGNADSLIQPEQNVVTDKTLEEELLKPFEQQKSPEEMSAAERIDKFYTFNSKNEAFQKLINSEYERVKAGNAIEHELSQAEKLAEERFNTRLEDSSMEAFLEKEGIVKPYQPKAFESDVLQRIEAQEAAREAHRLEEEARLVAIEEARLEAEAKKRAEEEARLKAEEEMRIKAAEEARLRAEEEARIRAEEEARIRAEQEARMRAEEEARLKAAEEARLRTEEEARIKAEEEARIRAEEEAKLRAEEEARLRAEEEARRIAEAEARARAEEEARLRAEADLRAAQEAAKIRAQQEARIAAEAEAQFKAEQERKRMEAEEAQRQLEEKRRILAQEADQAVAQEEARKVLEHTARLREEEEAKIRAAVASLRSGAALHDTDKKNEASEAHKATIDQINEMAKARDAFFADLDDKPEPVDMKPAAEEKPVTGRNTMLSSDDLTKTRVINKKDIAAGLNEATRVARKIKPAPAALDDDDFFNSLENAGKDIIPEAEEKAHEPQPMDFKEPAQPADDLEELLSQFEELTPVTAQEELKPAEEELTPVEEKPGLNDTMFMPQEETLNEAPSNDFDSYGNDIVAAERTSEKQITEDFYDNGFYGDDEELSKKELKERAKEQKRLEKERAKEEKAARKKAKRDYIEEDDYDSDDRDSREVGKGRIVLKVILVILIIILAVEVIGMGIRFLAPQSKAAEFIDNQLNKVIQLITGDDTEYSVIAAQVRTEPMEDKTELINAQIGNNKDGNIESIVYSADLAHDPDAEGNISDLVLSTPMTVVEWGRDDKNYPVYYDEQVVGQIIAFESNKVNLMNDGDEKALKMIKTETPLYNETAALKGTSMDGDFKKLEIGEIRQAGTNYYVWVRETIGDNTVKKVYSMYPEKEFVMKLTACYEI